MKKWQRALLTATAATAMTGCGAYRNIEAGTIIEKQNLPEEQALYINMDADTTNAERKLFFYFSDTEAFDYAQPGDVIKYTNRLDRRFIYVGRDRIISVNGKCMGWIRRHYER